MSTRYTNIRLILDKVMRHPLMLDIPLETAIDYTVDFIRLVGMPRIFKDKTEILHINNYMANIPCDYEETIQIRMAKGTRKVFRYTTDSFHLSNNKSDSVDLTYKIQGSKIITSIKNGDIEMAYRAIATDDEGYPLLLDNSSFTRALELYIKKQWFTILFDLGKINNHVYNQVLQDYSWAVGDCQAEFNRLDLDKAEALFNSWATLLRREREHSKGFVNNGTRELIKRH